MMLLELASELDARLDVGTEVDAAIELDAESGDVAYPWELPGQTTVQNDNKSTQSTLNQTLPFESRSCLRQTVTIMFID